MVSNPPPKSRRRTYADWYVWARRNLTSTVEICHACAQAASAAEDGGTDPPAAARHAAQNRVGPGWTSRAPDDVRAYAEWYDWCRSNLGVGGEAVHTATEAAIAAMDRGSDAAAAALAARGTVTSAEEPGPLPGPPGAASAPPPPAAGVSAPPLSPAPPQPPGPLPASQVQSWQSSERVPPPPPTPGAAYPTAASPAGQPPPPAYPPADWKPSPGARPDERRVEVPVWVTVLLGVGCGLSFLVAAIYLAVLNITQDQTVVGWAWFLIVAGSLAFIASLTALVAVLRKGAWARVMAIVAGAVLCLTCVGLLVGVPVIVGAAVGRREV